jgi:hypothetical protein
MNILKICAVSVSLFLAGCVILSPIEDRIAAPRTDQGYIAGSALSESGIGFAVYIKNIETNAEYALQMTKPSILSGSIFYTPDNSPEIYTLQAPPGEYMLTGWATFDWGSHEKMTKKKFDAQSPYAKPFTVKKGEVVFLGEFSTSMNVTERTYMWINLRYAIRPQLISTDSAKDKFIREYPKFEGAGFSCIFCEP